MISNPSRGGRAAKTIGSEHDRLQVGTLFFIWQNVTLHMMHDELKTSHSFLNDCYPQITVKHDALRLCTRDETLTSSYKRYTARQDASDYLKTTTCDAIAVTANPPDFRKFSTFVVQPRWTRVSVWKRQIR